MFQATDNGNLNLFVWIITDADFIFNIFQLLFDIVEVFFVFNAKEPTINVD